MTEYLKGVDSKKKKMYQCGLKTFLQNNSMPTIFEVMVKANELHTDKDSRP